VFSIFTDIKKPNNSFIKFGSYDQSAILPDHSLVNFRTKNPSTWELDGLLLRIAFIYLPVDDFRAFTRPIKDKFGGDI